MSKTIEEILALKTEARLRIPSCSAILLTGLYALHTMMALMARHFRGEL